MLRLLRGAGCARRSWHLRLRCARPWSGRGGALPSGPASARGWCRPSRSGSGPDPIRGWPFRSGQTFAFRRAARSGCGRPRGSRWRPGRPEPANRNTRPARDPGCRYGRGPYGSCPS
ncbi:hypothetical protein G6F59_017725 [Rhizopus arrhizus]|nr:hypothetical protein G6F59_017725 [Rhizopus arrhizus]